MLLTLGVAGVLALIFLPVLEWVIAILRWIQDRGVGGAVIFVLLYAPTAVLCGPSAALHVSCGALWGVGWGLTASIAGYNLGAVSGFLTGRYLLRRQTVAWAQKRKLTRLTLRVMDKHPARFVMVCRVAPFLPWGLSNYLFSISELPLPHFFLATLVSCPPYLLISVLAGVGLGEVAGLEEDDLSPANLGLAFWLLCAVGGVLGLITTFWACRYGRRLLREEERAEQEELERAEQLKAEQLKP